MNEIIFKIDRSHFGEVQYLDDAIEEINKRLDGYSILVVEFESRVNKIGTVTDSLKYNKQITIITSDERHQVYPKYSDLMFRMHNIRNDIYNYKNIFPIPLGYNSYGPLMKKFYPEKKLSERGIDVFFLGQANNRATNNNFVQSLSKISKSVKYNTKLQFTPGFRKGLSLDDYYRELGNAKIALAPDGVSEETFRYAESIGSGCVTIMTKKPDLWYYNDSPAIFLNDWSELNEDLIDNILGSDIDQRYTENLNYFNDKLSAKALADYIIEKSTKFYDETVN